MRVVAAATVVLVALVLSACGDPIVPLAASMSTTPVAATPLPVPATPTPTPTPTPLPTVANALPTPTPVPEPGLSEDKIRLAVIFDDNTGGAADGLFEDAWLATLAWQQFAREGDWNAFEGREIELVPFEASLFNHLQPMTEVCSGDFFAIVGAQSLGDADGAELLGTEDCFVPDFPGRVYGARRAVSPVTFVPNQFRHDQRQAGAAKQLAVLYPEASQNVAIVYFNFLGLQDEGERLREMLRNSGLNVTYEPRVALEDEDNLDERVVAGWEEAGAQSLIWQADPDRLIELLELLPEPPAFVLCELGCYSKSFIEEGGETVEGVYAWVPHIPFGEEGGSEEMALYLEWLAKVTDADPAEPTDVAWSEIGLQSWLAARFFELTVLSLTGDEGPDDPLTRQNVVAVASQLTTGPTPCFVLVVVRDGEWVREHPETPRPLDCDPDNIFNLIGSRQLGLLPAETSSTNSESEPDEQPTPSAEDAAAEDEENDG